MKEFNRVKRNKKKYDELTWASICVRKEMIRSYIARRHFINECIHILNGGTWVTWRGNHFLKTLHKEWYNNYLYQKISLQLEKCWLSEEIDKLGKEILELRGGKWKV